MSDDPARVWDFSAALNAINSVKSKQSTPLQPASAPSSPPSLTNSVSTESGNEASPPSLSTLGNLAKVFGYLGTSLDEDPTASALDLLERHKSIFVPKCTGDRTKVSKELREAKTVTFQDGEGRVTHGKAKYSGDEGFINGSSRSTRRKEHRKLAKVAAIQHIGESDGALRSKLLDTASHFHSTSDADTEVDKKLAVQQSQARRTVIQELLTPTKKPAKAQKPTNPHDLFLHQVSEQYASEPLSGEAASSTSRLCKGKSFKDASSGSPCVDLTKTFEKKTNLLKLLNKNFRDEASTLSCMKPFSSVAYGLTEADPSGIHIFVDMSNILIGLHDAIKTNRGLSLRTKIPRQKLSFYNFSLILERGRPVAKRCLAGSDILESVEEAVALGYENNCLDRVFKARKMTPRKQYFAERDRTRRTNGGKSGASSGGEGHRSGTDDGPYESEAKFVEQGVDEILHLKMMESLVDSDPGTMVLATGDAAEAEYSEGFLRMCERALSRGWKIELMSFKANMSGEYRRNDWMKRWKGNFRVIELDEYAEMLRL